MNKKQATDAIVIPQFTFDWTGHNTAVWSEVLAEFKDKPRIKALEIGVFEGQSTLWFGNNILTGEGSEIVCIDTFEGSPEWEAMGVSAKELEKRFKTNMLSLKGCGSFVYKGMSMYALRQFGAVPRFHFIYIDGSHRADDVLIDSVLSWQILRPGGVMIWDDYNWNIDLPAQEKPKMAIDAFLMCFAGQYEVLHQDYQVIVKKNK